MKKFRKSKPHPPAKSKNGLKRDPQLDLRNVPPEVMTKAVLAMAAEGAVVPDAMPDLLAEVRKIAPEPLTMGCSDEQGFLGMLAIAEYPYADETQIGICVNEEWVPSARSAARLQLMLDRIYTSLGEHRKYVDFHVDFRSYFNPNKYNPTLKSRCEADEYGQMSLAFYEHDVYYGSVAIKWLPKTNEVVVSLKEYPGFSRGFTLTEDTAPRLHDVVDQVREDFGDVPIVLTISDKERYTLAPEREDHRAAWELSCKERGISFKDVNDPA